MICLTCNKEFDYRTDRLKRRKPKYCSIECRPSYKPKSSMGLENCQVCGVSLKNIGAGRPKRNCSKACRERARLISKRKPKETLTCQNCNKEFESSKAQRFCCKSCRLAKANEESILKYKAKRNEKYPGGIRTTNCGWCKQPRTWKIGESVINAFHPDCTIDAQRARYRLKTTRRQKVVNPNRLSADKVVQTYGQNCHICLEPISLELPRTSKLGLTVDHVIPISKGGDDNIENLRPAHWICNIRKSNKLPKEVNA